MEHLKGLNDVQRTVATQIQGPLMVLAGAGAGKTKTLVARIQHLLIHKRVSPYKILSVTFSNKAAKEMRDRVAALPDDVLLGAAHSLPITTFHSFCARLLRMESHYLGLSKSFTIYDEDDSHTLIKQIMQRRNLSAKEISPYEISFSIDRLKNQGFFWGAEHHEKSVADGLDPALLKIDPFTYEFFSDYEKELRLNNALDFGGLISTTLQLFYQHPEVLEKYQRRYEYIHVDEYQDTNRAQFLMIKLLSGIHKNLCVVGDEDQSIYSWRGADLRNILQFETEFPGYQLIKLEQNYRSTKNIIEAASHVIANNTQRKGKVMWTDNPRGDLIKVQECGDDREESRYVASSIRKYLDQGDFAAKDIAVFYRNNAQSRSFEDALRQHRIPYKIIGGIKFYERKEIKDALAYLRLILNSDDSLSLSRIINVPARGIGTTSLKKIEEEAIQSQQSIFNFLKNKLNDGGLTSFSKKVQSSAKEFIELILEAKAMHEKDASPTRLFEHLMNKSGYFDYLKSQKNQEDRARLENLEEFHRAMEQFESEGRVSTGQIPTLSDFVESLALDPAAQWEDENAQISKAYVSLMTIHGSKGLEYDVVFLCGAEDGIFPSMQNIERGELALEEERRLFYVAMTRAMKHLSISFSKARMLYGSIKYYDPSRFMFEIPENFLDWKKKSKNFHSGSSYSDSGNHFSSNTFQDSDPLVDVPSYVAMDLSKFPKGTKIQHQLYGQGIVVMCEGSGEQEKVTVKFYDGSLKKFMAKFTPMEKLTEQDFL
ncbi:MAG: 3'-5' exonuclease [Bacteriovoracaceae bacterium]|nr:3'-5' exonuclease [Bacteriovoracaceae bacterium]